MNVSRPVLVKLDTARVQPKDDPTLKAKYRTSRFIFIASLYFKMVGVKNPTRQNLTELNTRFGLVKRDASLLFPAAISDLVWKNVNLVDIFKAYTTGTEPQETAISQVLEKSPGWVKYGDGEQMRDDVRAVFECVRAG